MIHPLRQRLLTAALVAVAVLGTVSACTSGSSDSAQRTAAQQFLSAVAAGKAAAAAGATTTPATARPELQASVTGLSLGAGTTATLHATTAHTKGAHATVDFTAAITLAGAPAWRYTGHVALTKSGARWQVQWSPADLHPGLGPGTHLLAQRLQPARAALEDSAGKPLFAPTPVVQVGIEPKLVKNLPALAGTLAGVTELQSTAAEITKAVKAAASPTDFVPLITLRRSVYQQIRPRIYNLDGTVFRASTELLAPSAHFGQPLLGSVGPATAAVVAASHGRVAAGDQSGLGGLQQAYDPQLAGSVGVTVVAARAGGTSGPTLAVLSRPKGGTPVRLTIDRATQQAAEQALGAVSQAAAVVAVQRSTGRVLADADTPATTYDYGLAGAFPPGSTFKIATWTAAFTTHPTLSPSSTVDCPATYTVDGRHFENENRFSYPPIPISSAFGYSCNTSAIEEAMALPTAAVGTAARALGLGARWTLPVTAFSGSLPPPAGRTEQAADAIGQGRVLASPLLLALLAGAASSGTPVRPTLLASAPVQKGTPLPAGLASKMTTLMTATVELPQGTGHVLADLPGVIGKTGTAEYGTAKPPRTHAWFAGVQGDLAFAVFVYDGASQHINPSALAHRFLAALPRR